MGLRLALGADRPGVVRHVLLGSGRTAAVGLTLGTVLSLAFGKVLSTLFVGIRALEPGILLVVFLLTGGAVLLASLFPALKASGVDPVRALSSD